MRTNRFRKFEVPIHVMAVVSEIIAEHDLTHQLVGGDDEEELIFVDVEYDRTNQKHQEAISEIEEYIEEFEDHEQRGQRNSRNDNKEDNNGKEV